MQEWLGTFEIEFLINLGLGILAGFLIGIERESRGKDAGISTHTFVITGSMIFTMLSMKVDPASTSRIAAQIVAGIGFLGAGLIIRQGKGVRNLTTAASVWYAAAIGMSLGFGFQVMAILASIAAIFVPRIPHFKHIKYKMLNIPEEKKNMHQRK